MFFSYLPGINSPHNINAMRFLPFILLLFLSTACKKDACESVLCVRGHCSNGVCNCEEGFTGSDCSQQVRPARIIVHKVVVKKFPPTDPSGGGWDLTNGADLFFDVLLAGNVVYTWQGGAIFNANPNSEHTFNTAGTLEFTQPESRYVIRLWDQDDILPHDYMGGIEFTPYHSTNNFPRWIELRPANADIWFDLEVQYVFP